MKSLITILAGLLVIAGCVGQVQINRAFEKVTAEDKIKSEQTALALGQRTFDMPLKKIMKAFITAFTNKNLTVLNVDKEIGFMVAEGGEILDAAKVRKIAIEGRIARLKSALPSQAISYNPGRYTMHSTVNFYEKGESQTLVKLGFSTKINSSIKGDKFEGTPPELLAAWYEEMWAEVEKSIFIQREIILDK
jgi:hypothetical protein